MWQLGQQLEAEGYTLYYSSAQRWQLLRLLQMLWDTWRLRKIVQVVLIDTYSTRNFYYALLVSQLCRLLKLSYIPILHGGGLPRRLERSPGMSRRIFAHAHVLVSPSRYLQEVFKGYGYDHVTYIPNSIDISIYPYQFTSVHHIQLLWVRSFSRIYNPQMAVQVLHALKQQGYQASLTMVGPDADGSLNAIQDLAKQLDVDVNCTGKLPKAQWHALAKQHNVFINTTHFDNMPVSVIEAMALGLPVVSTNVGGMPYLVQDGVDGLLVPDGDVEAMVAAILRLKEHPELAQQISAAARVKAKGFDWNVVRDSWIKVLGKK
jgi:glycosyltransferase involved in cell wall biosynthesis